ncbi:MAG: hypothetical protein ABSB42_11565 [Tepidisphaeraceae bacterium]|jgi:hypothetical protein
MRKRFHLRWLSPRALWAKVTGRAFRAAIKTILVRGYALVILGLVLAAGYFAVHYLFRTVFFAPTLPPQMLDWAGRLDVAALRSDQAEGVERPAPRAPISHYHSVDQWFQPDAGNGCTLSGCHQPLPHDRRAKVPAFANFHTTFLTCQMCHAPPGQRPAGTRWVNTDTDRPQSSPAILELLKYLELDADAIESQPASVDARIKDLLEQSIRTIGQDAVLDELLAEIQSSEPGSPVWKRAVSELTGELPLHSRGEYRAKLAWTAVADSRAVQFQTMTEQARQYLAAAPGSTERRDLQTAIHGSLAGAPTPCISCHDDEPGMLDFHAAGYSPKRSAFLSHLEIAKLMQQIRQGQHFYIPNVLEGGQ